MTDDEKVFFDIALKVSSLGHPSVSELLTRHGYMVEADYVSLMEDACPKNTRTSSDNKSETVVYANPWFQIIKNGRYHFMRENNVQNAAVIIVESNDCYLFVRQYRHSLGKDMLELPRGSAKDNETSVQCAMRELLEESGVSLKNEDIIQIGTVCPNSGVMASEIAVFFANAGDYEKKFEPCSDGIKDVLFIHKDEVLRMIHSHEITDAFSMSALMQLLAFRGRTKQKG